MKIEALTKEEYDWLVGLFLADGSKCIEKRGHIIYFYLSPYKDKDILEKLIVILKKMEFKPRVILKKTISTIAVVFFSKELFYTLPSKSQIYHPKSKDAFIAGFLDGDGFIQPKKDCIGLSQSTVKWICPFIHSYLKQQGIQSWYKDGVYTKYRMHYYRTSLSHVREKTYILDFMAKAKFI